MQQQGHWKSDGTDTDGKGTWSVETHTAPAEQDALLSSSTITVSTSRGSPMNLLCTTTPSSSPPIPTTRYFFKVHVVEIASKSCSLSVGVARPEEFKKGYGLKGMFYNGNLTNASAALKVSFGPHLKQGDTVVVEYVENAQQNNTIQLNIVVNGASLGTGFEIPKTAADESSFLPCLSLQGDMTLKAEVLSESPAIDPTLPEAPFFAGKWNVTEIKTAATPDAEPLWPIPGIDKEIVLQIAKQSSDDAWGFSIRVANNFGITKRITIVGEEKNDETATATVQNLEDGGMVRSTKMMPPPPLQEIESHLPSIMTNHWAQLTMDSTSSVLEIKSENGTTITKCEPSLAATGAACTSYKK